MHTEDLRLHHLVPARSHNATSLRHELTRWARDAEVPDETTDAVALAAYEAMVNVVTHAYPAEDTGPLELSAELRGNALDVIVRDQGSWQPPVPDPGPLNGRGLPLIHAMAGSAEIVPGPQGTTVRMRWPLPVAARARRGIPSRVGSGR